MRSKREQASHANTPNFVGIGAARAATTWLYKVLRSHPEVWLPPKKELHYFDRDPAYASPSFLSADRLSRRVFGTGPGAERFRSNVVRQLGKELMRRDWDAAKWTLRFYSGDNSEAWYKSLFQERSEKVTGEITPAYAMLETDDVHKVVELMPWAKVLFIIRDPMERTWSQARKGGVATSYLRGELTTDDIRQWIRKPTVAARNDYVRTIETWSAFFPKSQFLVLQYDELTHESESFLRRISEFLDIAPFPSDLLQTSKSRVNTTSEKSDCPEEILRLFATELFENTKAISELVGGYTVNWHRKVERLAERGDRLAAVRSGAG